mgnify:CR=1 FL=1
MPLDRELKSTLRDKVSTANKANVDAVADEVNAALATLDADDKDHARLTGWLEDLSVVKGGGVPSQVVARSPARAFLETLLYAATPSWGCSVASRS